VRRWLAALAVLALAGCSAQAGDLTSGWPVLGAATPFKPAVGACHETLDGAGPAGTYEPVVCSELHVSETFFVGTAPDAPVVPSEGSAPAKQAYATCAAKATGFLGGQWRSARIAVHLIWPSRAGWEGGARWFRCDVTEADLDTQDDASRTGSLAGALKGGSPLLLGCFNPKVDNDDVSTMRPVACTTRHRAEFAGLWTAPEISYAAQTKDRTRTAAGCRSAIAEYTGVPDDSDMQYRSGWISYNPTRAEWQRGERRVRCFLWFSDRTLTRSLKDAGPKVLPVH
jgi:hypothetical protein